MREKGPSILNVSCYFELIYGRHHHLCIRIVFGIHLIAFCFQALVVTEIVLLIVGPVIIAGLRYLFQQSATSATSPARVLLRSNFQGYGRFWLALVLGINTQTGLVVGLKLNPNVRSLVTF
jgi:hypothetical protein